MKTSSMMTTDLRVRGILLGGACAAYVGEADGPAAGVPVDRRCSACGIDRHTCDDQYCVRKENT